MNPLPVPGPHRPPSTAAPYRPDPAPGAKLPLMTAAPSAVQDARQPNDQPR